MQGRQRIPARQREPIISARENRSSRSAAWFHTTTRRLAFTTSTGCGTKSASDCIASADAAPTDGGRGGMPGSSPSGATDVAPRQIPSLERLR